MGEGRWVEVNIRRHGNVLIGGARRDKLARGTATLRAVPRIQRKGSTVANDLKPVELTAIDTTTQEWIGFPIPQLGVELTAMPLLDDPDTGMQVMKIIYRAGWVNPWHFHPCAHGIYVLDGSLVTHQGTYGPGSFVWFPEGGIMEHGATADGDCTFLFITNKPFDIHYVDAQ